jgi:hypothetical protein
MAFSFSTGLAAEVKAKKSTVRAKAEREFCRSANFGASPMKSGPFKPFVRRTRPFQGLFRGAGSNPPAGNE